MAGVKRLPTECRANPIAESWLKVHARSHDLVRLPPEVDSQEIKPLVGKQILNGWIHDGFLGVEKVPDRHDVGLRRKGLERPKNDLEGTLQGFSGRPCGPHQGIAVLYEYMVEP